MLHTLAAASPVATAWGAHSVWMCRRLTAARRDPLSGLWTREAFEARAARTLARRSHVAVVLCDLDGFKAVNDTYGHATGDAAIRAAAGSLTDALPGIRVRSRPVWAGTSSPPLFRSPTLARCRGCWAACTTR
ncbi:diguanylate cyclase domain-containing protein [Streptomyces longwoodensis]|uniref:diguanylate cyclase domain-containing protein n=1 Tax=Streptomyces longwoodensis TaxID=68231 RepID=UPI002B1DE495|nr:diguanylate cyclase [Streptomyces longwoodensis]